MPARALPSSEELEYTGSHQHERGPSRRVYIGGEQAGAEAQRRRGMMRYAGIYCSAILLLGCGGAPSAEKAPSDEGAVVVSADSPGGAAQVAGDAPERRGTAARNELIGVWVMDIEATMAIDEKLRSMPEETRARAVAMATNLLKDTRFEFTEGGVMVATFAGKREESTYTIVSAARGRYVIQTTDKTGKPQRLTIDAEGDKLFVQVTRDQTLVLRRQAEMEGDPAATENGSKIRECNAMITVMNDGAKEIDKGTKEVAANPKSVEGYKGVAASAERVADDLSRVPLTTPRLKKLSAEYQAVMREFSSACLETASAVGARDSGRMLKGADAMEAAGKREEELIRTINEYCQAP